MSGKSDNLDGTSGMKCEVLLRLDAERVCLLFKSRILKAKAGDNLPIPLPTVFPRGLVLPGESR